MVAYGILFSLFERAYLMFTNQTAGFRQRQWSGWKYFLYDLLRHDNVRTAWVLSKNTYDTDFQAFMDRKIATVLAKPVPEIWGQSPPTETPVAESVAEPAFSPDLPKRTLEAAVGEPMGT